MTNYQIRDEPFTGQPPLPPYGAGGARSDIQGAKFTHAIYDGDRLIFRAGSLKQALALIARLNATTNTQAEAA